MNSLLRLAVLASCIAFVPAGFAQELKSVRLITFHAPFTWPIWVAQSKGFFVKQGIDLHYAPTPDSTVLFLGLIEGRFDVAMAAMDNLVAWREGQAEVAGDGSDLFAIMGGSSGLQRLVTVPEVKSFAELKGKTLSVDTLNSGFALILREILERGGLKEGDYHFARVGAGSRRFEALVEKQHAGTLVTAPQDVFLKARGYNVLASAVDALGAYQGNVGISRRAWAQSNRDTLVGYIAAVISGVEWLYDPGNKEEALAIFVANQKMATPQVAQSAYATLLDPKEGFARQGKVDIEGVRTVLWLRSKYGIPPKKLGDPENYYDPDYYTKALERLGGK
jgi:ABC-type nitrate/sulfonate/bicarbonate transport system substrate-binding protein